MVLTKAEIIAMRQAKIERHKAERAALQISRVDLERAVDSLLCFHVNCGSGNFPATFALHSIMSYVIGSGPHRFFDDLQPLDKTLNEIYGPADWTVTQRDEEITFAYKTTTPQ